MIVKDVFADQDRPSDEIQQRILAVAVEALRAKGRDPALYQAKIGSRDERFFVSFIDRTADLNRSVRGDPGKIPGLAVRIDPSDLTIVAVTGIR